MESFMMWLTTDLNIFIALAGVFVLLALIVYLASVFDKVKKQRKEELKKKEEEERRKPIIELAKDITIKYDIVPTKNLNGEIYDQKTNFQIKLDTLLFPKDITLSIWFYDYHTDRVSLSITNNNKFVPFGNYENITKEKLAGSLIYSYKEEKRIEEVNKKANRIVRTVEE